MRGIAAALFSTLAAATSHSLAGGTLSPVGLVLAATFATIVCIALAGRTLSAWRLAASVGLSQFVFHLAFSSIGTGGTVTHTGHHTMTVTADATAGFTTDGWMWAAHASAAVVTVLMLLHGEAAFWRLRELVLFALSSWLVPVPELPGVRREPTGLVDRPRLFLLLRAALQYRGPPAISFA